MGYKRMMKRVIMSVCKTIKHATAYIYSTAPLYRNIAYIVNKYLTC